MLHGDYNVNFWPAGLQNEWYEYRLEKFDSNDRVVMDKVVRVVANATSRRYIDSEEFAEHVAANLDAGACVQLVPNLPFRVRGVNG